MKDVKKDLGFQSGGAFHWYFQRISGAVLLIALLVHFWVLHFFAPPHGEITFDAVMERLQHPLWRALDILFLVVGIYHGMNGIMISINDYLHRPVLRIFVVGLLWVAALFFLIIGTLTILGLPNGGIM